jgi:DNA-binding PadR family transcriptional regulator
MAKTINSLKQCERTAVDYTDRMYWNGIIKMSLSKFFILSILRRRPMHGYEITREVECATNGCCAPTEGTIYPVLKEFERGGYVSSHTEMVAGRERKIYTLSDKGRQAFAVATEAWMEVTSHISNSHLTP